MIFTSVAVVSDTLQPRVSQAGYDSLLRRDVTVLILARHVLSTFSSTMTTIILLADEVSGVGPRQDRLDTWRPHL
jgi:hypothetical protein